MYPRRFRSLLMAFLPFVPLPCIYGDGPADRKQAVRTDRYGDPLPEGALARLGTVRWRHPRVRAVAFSFDGKRLASGGADGVVRIWDAATGEPLHALAGHKGWVASLAFSPDGKWLVSAIDRRETLRLWETTNGRLVRSWNAQSGVLSVTFTADSKRVCAGGEDGSVRFWDVTDGTMVRSSEGHGGMVKALAISANGKTAAVGDKDGTLRTWELETGKLIRSWKAAKEEIRVVALSPDGKFVASGTGNEVRVWEAATGREIGKGARIVEPGHALAFSPDGKLIASGFVDFVWLSEVATGKKILSGSNRHGGANHGGAYALAFSPDGRTLASGGDDNTLWLWDTATGKRKPPIEGHHGGVHSIAFSPDGRILASVGEDAILRLWDTATRRLLHTCKGHGFSLLSVAFSPDGKVVASGSNDAHEIRLWEVSTGKTIHALKYRQGFSENIAFSPDGKALVSEGGREGFRLWDVTTGKPIRDFVQKGGVSGVTFSPDGETIASVSSPEMSLALWRTATGKRIRRWEGPDREVHVVVFSPVGGVFATCGYSARTRLWDAATGREIRVCGGPAESLAFSPDGRVLFSASGNVLQLWETASGQQIRRWKGHQGWNTSVAFSADGRTVASGNNDTTILLWDAFPSGPARLKASPLQRRDLQTLWSDLASDAARAYAAIDLLSRQPQASIPFLQQRLPSIAPLKAGRLDSLIADLDSDVFAKREQAQRELARLGELALPALRRGIAGHPSAEQRRRMEHALKEAEETIASPEYLRSIRAITVLERADTVTARELLSTLASGAPEARLTQEAKAALERLTKRPGTKP